MADTIPKRLFEQARKNPDRPAYLAKEGPVWKTTNWAGYAAEVMAAGRALVALGFAPGQCVCILGFNRPEWVIMDLATMSVGGAPAGIYTTCSAKEVQYIVHHAEAPIVLVENAEQAEKIRSQREHLPHLQHVVVMRGPRVDGTLSWEEFLAKGEGVEPKEVHDRIAALEPQGLATLIYTSGTTGPPKGVMLSHENLAWTATTLLGLVDLGGDGRTLSYLPLSHIAEQMLSLHGPVTAGSAVYFAESIDKVLDNLKDARPTVFFGVPRIWEKMHAGIAGKLQGATGAKKALVTWARGVASRANALRMRGDKPTGALAAQYALAQGLVFRKLAAAIGLDQARVLVSGAAPIGKDVLDFFASLDLVVQEVYGQSEDTGPTSLNVTGRTLLGSVGPPLPGVEVKIADDGEILVRGKNVFLGYFKDDAATEEALDEQGYLHSGDLGRLDPQGFLHITGRKKDIIITAGGKNITPKNLESAVKSHPAVGECVVVGDRRKYLTALVSLDPEGAAKWIAEHDAGASSPVESTALRASIQATIDALNAEVARVEQLKKFTILPRPFSLEQGELTPTLKVKRNVVAKHFAKEIEALYEGSDA